jgi:hypothetical protein
MSYLNFFDGGRSGSGLTRVWYVHNLAKTVLGRIKWSGSWRTYVFMTTGAEIQLDKGCLREIADFCETETVKHKTNKKDGEMIWE